MNQPHGAHMIRHTSCQSPFLTMEFMLMNDSPASAFPHRTGGILFKVVVGLVLITLIGGSYFALTSRRDGTDDSKADYYTVTRQSFDVTATSSGELRAKKQTVIRSELDQDAPIVEIVAEGSRVKAGEVLVRLNGDDLQSDLENELLQQENARAEVISATGNLDIQKTENVANIRKAKVDVELAEVELLKFEEGDVVEKRLELALAVEKGERETKRLSEKVERSRQLYAKQFLSKDELEIDELELIEVRAQLEKAKVARSVYDEYTYKKERKQLESDLASFKSELEKVLRRSESDLATKEADLINKRRQLELRLDKVKKLEGLLAKTVIRAPTDGLVVYATSLEQFAWMNNQEPLNVGTQIRPNQEIIMLPDTSEMVAAVKVAENLVGRIKPDQPAILTIDAAQGKRYDGQVESIGIMAQSGGWRDPNVREYEVRITLNLGTEPHTLKPSMRCESRITLMSVENVIAAPLTAVFTEGPNHFVYVPANDRYNQTQVRIGRRSDTMVEIVSGLKEGDKVILREPPAARILKAKFEEPVAQTLAIPGSGAAARRPRPTAAAEEAAPIGEEDADEVAIEDESDEEIIDEADAVEHDEASEDAETPAVVQSEATR